MNISIDNRIHHNSNFKSVLKLTYLDRPHNGEPSLTNSIWISEWLTLPLYLAIWMKYPRFIIFVYGYIQWLLGILLKQEQTLVPGVLLTHPKEYRQFEKTTRWCDHGVLHSSFVLLGNYSQTKTLWPLTSWESI